VRQNPENPVFIKERKYMNIIFLLLRESSTKRIIKANEEKRVETSTIQSGAGDIVLRSQYR
jgi:hypothetical protein